MAKIHSGLLCIKISSCSRCYGTNTTYLLSINSRMSGCLWIAQLSMTITEFGSGNGFMCSRRRSMNCLNVAVQNDPSTMSQCKMPS